MKYTPKELEDNINVSKSSPVKNIISFIITSLFLILVIYITLGFTVDIAVDNISSNIQNRLEGLLSFNFQTEQKEGIENEKIISLFNRITQKLPNKIDKKFNLNIIDEKMVNAYILPPNQIIIFSGLLDEVESENELAFILGHELGHFINKDHLRSLGRGLLFVGISMILFGEENFFTEVLMDSLVKAEMKFSQQQEKKLISYHLKY